MGLYSRWFYLKVLRTIGRLRGSQEAIALGAAIGVFVAFTPTVGFQMLIGALIATLFKASRPAAMIPAWISNPVTIPPIYAFTYWVGTLIVPGPSAAEVYERLKELVDRMGQHNFYELHKHFFEVFMLGKDLFWPMMIGGVMVGAILGCLTYPAALWGVKEYRLIREKRRHERARRRAMKRERRS